MSLTKGNPGETAGRTNLFQHKNAWGQKTQVLVSLLTAVRGCGFQTVYQSHYSPGLLLSEYYVIANMKNTSLRSIITVIILPNMWLMNVFLPTQSCSFIKAFQTLQYHWEKYVGQVGYINKYFICSHSMRIYLSIYKNSSHPS